MKINFTKKPNFWHIASVARNKNVNDYEILNQAFEQDVFEEENRNSITPTKLVKYKFRSSKALSLSEETVALIPSGVRIIVPFIFLLIQ